MLDPKQLTKPFWYGKREGVRVRKRDRERERERAEEKEEGEAPGTLTAALQISEPKSEALMVSFVHICPLTHSFTHSRTRTCTHLDFQWFKPSIYAKPAFFVRVLWSLIPSSNFPSPHLR